MSIFCEDTSNSVPLSYLCLRHGGFFRHIARLVRPLRARPAVAPHARSLPHLALGGHSPADARGAGAGLLPALCRALPRRAGAGRGLGGRGAQTVAGAGLLQPGPQPACRCAAGRRTVRRGVPRGGERRAFAARRGRLYGRGDLLGSVECALRRCRRQCLPRAGAAVRPGDPDRHGGREAGLCRTGAAAARPGTSGTVQSGDHGFRGVAVHPRTAAVRRLPLRGALSGPCGREHRRTSRQAGTHADARPLVQLPARHLRGADGAVPPRCGRHLAGVSTSSRWWRPPPPRSSAI